MQGTVKAGVDVNARTTQGDTPYKIAAGRGKWKLASLLRKNGGIWNSEENLDLVKAARDMDLDRVKDLVSMGADVNVIDVQGEYLDADRKKCLDFVTMPLIVAVEKGDCSIAEFLIAKGADIGIAPIWYRKRTTLLGTAINNGNKEMVEVLLAGGADINQTSLLTKKGKGRYTPLKLSQLLGHMEIAEILRANGAEIEKKSRPARANTGQFGTFSLKVPAAVQSPASRE